MGLCAGSGRIESPWMRAGWVVIACGAMSLLSTRGVAQTQAQKEGGMNPKIVQQEAFTVVGIAVRTNNAREMTPEGVIGKQWARFMQEGLLEKIPNRVGGNIIALITDYASDKDGDYTQVMGRG